MQTEHVLREQKVKLFASPEQPYPWGPTDVDPLHTGRRTECSTISGLPQLPQQLGWSADLLPPAQQSKLDCKENE